ncbi:MAG: hypothetical protein ACYCX5_12315 [Coriobacteriia bacterium]
MPQLAFLQVIESVAWGVSSGELNTFRSAPGLDGALQMLVFFGILYATFFDFAARYLTGKAAESYKEDTADA